MPRTVQRLEAGECALRVTLKDVAEALKIDVSLLIPASPPLQEAPRDRRDDIELTLQLKIGPEALDQCGQLLDVVAAVMKLGRSDDVEVTKVGAGITISVPDDVARRFIVMMEDRVRKGEHVSSRMHRFPDYDIEQKMERDPLNLIDAIDIPEKLARGTMQRNQAGIIGNHKYTVTQQRHASVYTAGRVARQAL